MKRLRWIVFLLILFNLGGCHFYRSGLVKNITPEYIVQKNEIRDYVIVHHESELWHFTNLRNEGDFILGKFLEVVPVHQAFKQNEYRTAEIKRYKRRELLPTNEVHVYITKYELDPEGNVRLNVNDVEKIEVYDEALGATITTYVAAAGVIANVAGIIILAIACACPSVYAVENQEFVYQGSAFAGAIGENMERNDFLPLSGFDVSEEYLIKIANEKPETEFIDLAAIRIIEHGPDQKAMIDRNGEVAIITKEIRPSKAHDSFGDDISAVLNNRDDVSYSFNRADDENGKSGVFLNFENPGSTQAELVVRAKNSKWMDFIFLEFFQLFGDRWEEFKSQQNSRTQIERVQWLKDQGVLLNVFLDKGDGWEAIDYFDIAGSISAREMVMKVDGLNKGEMVKLKIESGFGFWELDYVALDFDTSESFVESSATLKSAIDKEGKEWADELKIDDDLYVSDIQQGNYLTLTYGIPEAVDSHRSFFLHSKGYYEMDLTISGKPKLAYLKSFRKPGRFSRFSMERFQEFSKVPAKTTSE